MQIIQCGHSCRSIRNHYWRGECNKRRCLTSKGKHKEELLRPTRYIMPFGFLWCAQKMKMGGNIVNLNVQLKSVSRQQNQIIFKYGLLYIIIDATKLHTSAYIVYAISNHLLVKIWSHQIEFRVEEYVHLRHSINSGVINKTCKLTISSSGVTEGRMALLQP